MARIVLLHRTQPSFCLSFRNRVHDKGLVVLPNLAVGLWVGVGSTRSRCGTAKPLTECFAVKKIINTLNLALNSTLKPLYARKHIFQGKHIAPLHQA